jgi:Arc/MetJ-type ribon-helix-helix transcriptional regulator
MNVTTSITVTVTEKEKLVPLNVKIPRSLKNLMKEVIELGSHKDLSELTREALWEKIKRNFPKLYEKLDITELTKEALREKIKRDAPALYEKLFKKEVMVPA